MVPSWGGNKEAAANEYDTMHMVKRGKKDLVEGQSVGA
jgi:hypothetical protein